MAIKNFKAPDAKKIVLTDKIRVSDYMVSRSKLITFSPDLKVIEAIEILVKNNISGAPVVDTNDKLLGIISEGDCMKKIANSKYYNIPLHDEKVEDYMSPNVDYIDENSNIFDVAQQFFASSRKRFPVVKDGLIIGQISRRDILKAALEIN